MKLKMNDIEGEPLLSPIRIDKPDIDKRNYHYVTLTNGLPCLLISDESTDKAAAGLCVKVGQLDDSLPGLAHLLEHMLFLGTSKFPNENELDKYLSNSSGHSNAYTDLQQTVYYVECHNDRLQGALERFGSCFACPLLQKDSIEKEIKAVDSEHAKNTQQDHWRAHQLARSILGRGGHPYGQFGSGSCATLLPNKIQADQRIAELEQHVRAFYEQYYRTNNMTVAILGSDALEQLAGWAEEFFGDIPPGNDSNLPSSVPPLPVADCLPCQVNWVPTRPESRTLELQWPLREVQSLYLAKPTRILSHLLGHEGPGSLLHVLRHQLGWVQELGSDDVSKSCREFSIFTLQLELTAAGVEHVTDILELVYVYLEMLRCDIPTWVFEELQTMGLVTFRFLSQHGAAETVQSFASSMQFYRPEHVLSGAILYWEPSKDLMFECLSSLRPENMMVMLGNATLAETCNETDINYGTKYCVNPLDNTALKKCKDLDSKYANSLHLPAQNDMLATDFTLIEPMSVFAGDTNAPPRCLADSETCRLWYKPDTAFSMPKVNLMILLRTATAYATCPEDSVLASLWAEVMHEHCNDFAYAASMAGLHCDFSNNRRGVEIHISGYNHKAHILLQRIVDEVLNLPKRLTVDLFERVQDKIKQEMYSFMVADPYQHGIYAADLLLESPKWSVQNRLEALSLLTHEDLINFSNRLIARIQVEMLVHGNISPDGALQLSNVISDAWRPAPPLHMPALRVVRLDRGRDFAWRFRGWNDNDTNSCLVNIFQVGPMSVETNAMLSLLHHLIREPAFNQLRTEEQLGYIVHTQVKTNGDIIKSLLILIQSDSYDPVYMNQRVEAFLVTFRIKLTEMSTEEFANQVDSVCQSLLEKNKNLGEETSKHWKAITNRSYHFERLRDIAQAARVLTKLDVLRTFDRYLLAKSPYRCKLALQIFGANHAEALKTAGQSEFDDVVVTDPNDFVASHQLFASQSEVAIEDLIAAAYAKAAEA